MSDRAGRKRPPAPAGRWWAGAYSRPVAWGSLLAQPGGELTRANKGELTRASKRTGGYTSGRTNRRCNTRFSKQGGAWHAALSLAAAGGSPEGMQHRRNGKRNREFPEGMQPRTQKLGRAKLATQHQAGHGFLRNRTRALPDGGVQWDLTPGVGDQTTVPDETEHD